ncbi:hypothetical protein ColKHC_01615 [Colletotrichum higginsianum]|nr:hypothetical protein ColKHC_01615 [Colletotrichum higginsianum]
MYSRGFFFLGLPPGWFWAAAPAGLSLRGPRSGMLRSGWPRRGARLGHLGNEVRVHGVKAGDDLFEVLAAAGGGVEVNDVVEAVVGRGERNDGLEAGDEALHDAEELFGVGGGVDGLVVVAAGKDALLGDAADLVEVGIVVGEVEGDEAGRLVLDLDIGEDLTALVLLGVVTVGDDDRDVAEQVENGLCEAWRAALARDVVVLDVTPAEEVLQGDGDGGLAAADGGDGHEDDVPGDFGADGGGGGHVRELEVGGVGALDILEGEEVVAQGDDAVVLLIELGEVLVGLEAAAGVEEVLLGDLDVLLVARWLARDHGLADDETLDVAVAVGARLGNLLEEGLDLVDVVHGDEADLAEAPGIAEGLNQGARVGDELGQVEVDAVDVQASLVRTVLEDVLFEGVVTELGNGGGVAVAQLPGEVLFGLAQGGQLLLDHALSGDGVADVGVASLTGRVLAADEQGAVLKARDEDDAAVLLEATHDDLGLVASVLCCKEAAGSHSCIFHESTTTPSWDVFTSNDVFLQEKPPALDLLSFLAPSRARTMLATFSTSWGT